MMRYMLPILLIVGTILAVHTCASREEKKVARDEVNIALTLEQRQEVMNRISKGDCHDE